MAQNQIDQTELLLIGGSSGSLEVVLRILAALPADFSLPILLVLHRSNTTDSLLNEVLLLKSGMPLLEVEEKEPIRPSTVYLAPADYHVLIEKDRTFSLDYSEKLHYSRPSIDVTFTSAAEVFGSRLMAVLLSGANEDGTAGMQAVKDHGGYTIIQDPEDAIVHYMPQHALKQVQADAILAGNDLLRFLLSVHESRFT
jgi:two-component system chemotaxis response regulator CheB